MKIHVIVDFDQHCVLAAARDYETACRAAMLDNHYRAGKAVAVMIELKEKPMASNLPRSRRRNETLII